MLSSVNRIRSACRKVKLYLARISCFILILILDDTFSKFSCVYFKDFYLFIFSSLFSSCNVLSFHTVRDHLQFTRLYNVWLCFILSYSTIYARISFIYIIYIFFFWYFHLITRGGYLFSVYYFFFLFLSLFDPFFLAVSIAPIPVFGETIPSYRKIELGENHVLRRTGLRYVICMSLYCNSCEYAGLSGIARWKFWERALYMYEPISYTNCIFFLFFA